MTISFNTATTLNGFLATPDDSLEWLFTVQGEIPDLAPFVESVSILVLGSTTYLWVLEHENLLAEPAKWPGLFGSRPLFVFTHRELPVPDGADVRFVQGAVAEVLPSLRSAAGDGTIWVQGGGELAGQFFDAGALDEIVLAIAPVFLAAGAPLLPRTITSDRLSLRSAEKVGQFTVVTLDVLPPS